MPDRPVLAAGALVVAFSGISLVGSLLGADRAFVVLANAPLVGIGVFLVRRGLQVLPWELPRGSR